MSAGPEKYINQAGFAARIGIAIWPMTHRIVRGAVPEPDVVVGDVLLPGGTPGWSLERVQAYIEYERLLRKLHPRHGRSLDVFFEQGMPSWWQADTEWFLSQAETAFVLGYERITITMGMLRGTFPVRPKVRVGESPKGVKQGWDHSEIVEFGRQNRGQLDVDGKIADIARSGPPRKALDPAYWERVTADRRGRRQAKLDKSGIGGGLPIAA